MYCNQCGYKNHQHATFCKRCGSDLRRNADHPEDNRGKARGAGALRFAPGIQSVWEPALRWIKKKAAQLRQIKIDPARLMIVGGILAKNRSDSSPHRSAQRERRERLARWGILLGAVILIIIFVLAISCSGGSVGSFGNTGGNVAGGGHVVSNGFGTYFSRLYGDNPGLYYTDSGNGSEFKMSYRKFTQIGLSGDWIYGVDVDDGQYYRVSLDGTKTQQVLPRGVLPKNAAIADNYVYYINRADQKIYRADLSKITGRKPASPQRLYDQPADCLNVTADSIYFLKINSNQPSFNPAPEDQPESEEVSEDPPQQTVNDLPSNNLTDSVDQGEVLPSVTAKQLIDPELVGRAAMGKAPIFGTIMRMDLNGRKEKSIGVSEAAYMTVAGGTLYYGVPATIWVNDTEEKTTTTTAKTSTTKTTTTTTKTTTTTTKASGTSESGTESAPSQISSSGTGSGESQTSSQTPSETTTVSASQTSGQTTNQTTQASSQASSQTTAQSMSQASGQALSQTTGSATAAGTSGTTAQEEEQVPQKQISALLFKSMQLETGETKDLGEAGLVDSVICVSAISLYFTNMDGFFCRMNSDGSGYELFSFAGERISHPGTAGDWVYFFADDGKSFCRMKSNGLGFEKLASE